MRASIWISCSLFAALLPLAGAASQLASPARDAAPFVIEDYRRPAQTPYPLSNPFSAAKHELGRALFFDTDFSRSQSRSCATCHDPRRGWGDGLPRAQGEAPEPLPFRSPTLLDDAWIEKYGWDGKFRDLEAVAFAPITTPKNMNMSEAELVERLSSNPEYPRKFALAFEDGAISRRNIELALATFERSIRSGKAPFDYWIDGDEAAIGQAAKRGFQLFAGKAGCAECHSGWSFSDGSFHDIGTGGGDDIGRGRLFPSSRKLRYAFKTPTLRDVARRAPYMHDGSRATLEEVIDLYNKGGVDRPSRSELIKPLGLSEADKADLIAFLESLSDQPTLAQPGASDGRE